MSVKRLEQGPGCVKPFVSAGCYYQSKSWYV